MGKNNKARRAAKAKSCRKKRYDPSSWGSRTNDSGPPTGGEPLFNQEEIARQLLLLAARDHYLGNYTTEGLHRLTSMSPDVVDRKAELAMLDQVEAIWMGGWQPAELHRQGRIGCTAAASARLVHTAIATDYVGRRSVTLDQRWINQIEGLELPEVNGRTGWVRRWINNEGFDRATAINAIVDALANILHLPKLEPILPLPGAAGSKPKPSPAQSSGNNGASGTEANPILERIRALLAMAESTTFEAEATAFTAKAQALMTRHAIDAAVLQGQNRVDEHPITIRVPIDSPYADAKSLLLQTVAQATRCRSVFHGELAMSSVVGFSTDVGAVELLFTSLLLQAQTALSDATKRAPAGTRTRSQSYRSAFLLAYTGRIKDRLNEINEAIIAEVKTEQGSDFLPVLRSRLAEVDEAINDQFGDLIGSKVRGGYDRAGWASGEAAADNAQLNFGKLIS